MYFENRPKKKKKKKKNLVEEATFLTCLQKLKKRRFRNTVTDRCWGIEGTGGTKRRGF